MISIKVKCSKFTMCFAIAVVFAFVPHEVRNDIIEVLKVLYNRSK
jgi:hypothetical protein